MKTVFKPFNQLTVRQLYDVYKLRSVVFVVEQNCAYQDVDEKDLKAFHLLFYEKRNLFAYCRILPPGISYPECSIGRVVTAPQCRKSGYGKLLMKEAIQKAKNQFHTSEIVISAQTYLLKFYNELGFKQEGDIYPEDDIPHVKMRLK